jgi:hypothetical protein
MFQLNLSNLSQHLNIQPQQTAPENWLDELKQLLVNEKISQMNLQVLSNTSYLMELYRFLTDKQTFLIPDFEKQAIMDALRSNLELNSEDFSAFVEKTFCYTAFPRNPELLITQCILQGRLKLKPQEQQIYQHLAQMKGLLILPDGPIPKAQPEVVKKIQKYLEFDINTHLQPFQIFFQISCILKEQLSNYFSYTKDMKFDSESCVPNAWQDLLLRFLDIESDVVGQYELLLKDEQGHIVDVDWLRFFYHLSQRWIKNNILQTCETNQKFLEVVFNDQEPNPLTKNPKILTHFHNNTFELVNFLNLIEDSETLQSCLVEYFKSLSLPQLLPAICAIVKHSHHASKFEFCMNAFKNIDARIGLTSLLEKLEDKTPLIFKLLSERRIPHISELYEFLFMFSPARLFKILNSKNAQGHSFLMFSCLMYPLYLEDLLTLCESLPTEHLIELFSDIDQNQQNLLQACLQTSPDHYEILINFFAKFIPKINQSIILSWKNQSQHNLLLQAATHHTNHLVSILEILKDHEPALQISLLKDTCPVKKMNSLAITCIIHPKYLKAMFSHLAKLPKPLVIDLLSHPNIFFICPYIKLEVFKDLIQNLELLEPGLVSKLLLTKDDSQHYPIFYIRANSKLNATLNVEIKKLPKAQQIELFACTGFTHPSSIDVNYCLALFLSDTEPKNQLKIQSILYHALQLKDLFLIILNFYLNSPSIQEHYQKTLADLFTTREHEIVFTQCFFDMFLACYDSSAEASHLIRLEKIFNFVMQKAIKSLTLSLLLTNNLPKFLNKPVLINYLIRNLLHTTSLNLTNIINYLQHYQVNLSIILNTKPVNCQNLLHFSITESINSAIFANLIQIHIVYDELTTALIETNECYENVIQAAISLNSPLLPLLFSALESLPPQVQSTLVSAEHNFLIRAMQKTPYGLKQVCAIFKDLHTDLLQACLQDKMLWKTAIGLANGSLEIVLTILEKFECETLISILERQDEEDTLTVFEHLSPSKQAPLKQFAQDARSSLYTIFERAKTQSLPESKKLCLEATNC